MLICRLNVQPKQGVGLYAGGLYAGGLYARIYGTCTIYKAT